MSARGFLAALALASLAVTACTPGVQPLLDEYNALFGNVTERGQDAGQEGGGWWKSIYKVPSYFTLNLEVPQHCDTYKWNMMPDSEFPEEQSQLPANFNINKYVDSSGSWLKLDLRDAGFKGGTSYILTCETVKGDQTKTYTCTVVIDK